MRCWPRIWVTAVNQPSAKLCTDISCHSGHLYSQILYWPTLNSIEKLCLISLLIKFMIKLCAFCFCSSMNIPNENIYSHRSHRKWCCNNKLSRRCKCCCPASSIEQHQPVKSNTVVRTHSSFYCVSLFAWLSIHCQKIPPFCVLMTNTLGRVPSSRGRQPWTAQSFRKRKPDTES